MKKFMSILCVLLLLVGTGIGEIVSDERGSVIVNRGENALLVMMEEPILTDRLVITLVCMDPMTDEIMESEAQEVYSQAMWKIDGDMSEFEVLDYSYENEDEKIILTWTARVKVARKEANIGFTMKPIVPEKETEEIVIIRMELGEEITAGNEYIAIGESVEEAEAIFQMRN